MSRLDVLMPFRAATPHRQALHDWTWALWEKFWRNHADVNVIVADDGRTDDLFSPAAAVNRAFRLSTADYLIIEGSGHFPHTDQHLDWLIDTLDKHPWVGAYAGHRELTQQATMRLLAEGPSDTDPMSLPAGRQTPYAIGVIAMRRDVFLDAGGMDERFVGWGYEDTALRAVLTAMYGKPPQPTGKLTTLWHPPSTRRNLRANAALYKEVARGVSGGPERAKAYIAKRGTWL